MNEEEPAEEAEGIVPRPRAHLTAAWTAIFLCLAVVGSVRAFVSSRDTRVAGEDGKGLSAEISARYAIGASRLRLFAVTPGQRSDMTGSLLQQIDRSAKAPEDRLRAVILVAELDGPEAAIRRLNALHFPAGTEPARDRDLLLRVYPADGSALDDADRQRLVERFGWSGRLALTWGRPDQDPVRAALLREALRTFAAGVFTILSGLAMLAAGLILTVVVLARWRAGKMPPAFVPPSVDSGHNPELAGFLVEAFAIYLVWFIAVSPLGRWISGGRWPWFWTTVGGIGPVWCLWPLFRGACFSDLRRSLGWTRGAGVLREAAWGIVGYVAGTPLIVLGIVMTYLLSVASGEQPSHPVMNWVVWDLPRLAAVLALVSVYAPLAEETMFRGALYAGVRGFWGSVASGLLVAFIFASLHPQGWTAIPALMGIAAVLGLLREWRGSSIASMTAHALNNGAVTLIFALLAG